MQALLAAYVGIRLEHAAILEFKLAKLVEKDPKLLPIFKMGSMTASNFRQAVILQHTTHVRRKLNLKSASSFPSAMIVDDVISFAGKYSMTSCQTL